MTSKGRSLASAVVRPLLSSAALVLVYYRLPVNRPVDEWAVLRLVAGLGLVVVVLLWQVRAILRSAHPVWQGAQALAVVLPLFLLIFANFTYLLARHDPHSFTTPLTRTDALYFAITVFATVGFGDITPVTQAARVLVMIQMIGDLLVVGVALRVITTAVSRGRHADG